MEITPTNKILSALALLGTVLFIRKNKQPAPINGIGSTTLTGDFGPIYTRFQHKGKEAILHLMKVQKGECMAALHRTDIGDIDLIWGKVTNAETHEGYGLAHIIDKHGETIHYNNLTFRIEDFIPIVVQFGEKSDIDRNKIIFDGYGFRFVIQTSWNGKKKKFLLTAFDIQ